MNLILDPLSHAPHLKTLIPNQKYLVKKYFNNNWLWSYIENII